MAPLVAEEVNEDKKIICVREAKIGPANPFNLAHLEPFIPPEGDARLLFAYIEEDLHDLLSPNGE